MAAWMPTEKGQFCNSVINCVNSLGVTEVDGTSTNQISASPSRLSSSLAAHTADSLKRQRLIGLREAREIFHAER
ncbi:hypothetical protein RRG08_053987 [Elysia crispata]|uniref:Uncharacterized protein n=1 Tax=Elysia crispata TaxID=231223 RepID=A0AAE1BB34_9GAST|nr:hypothetical protein RRG08_053987 [Elysia crispata]